MELWILRGMIMLIAIIIFIFSYHYFLKCWSELKNNHWSVIIRDIPLIIFAMMTVASSIYIIFL